jgi:hypothetical protein
MPAARKREPRVAAKAKLAVDHLFSVPGATLQSAAKLVNLPVFKLRYLLMMPHNARFMLHEKQARLEAASAGNVGALLSIRDFGDNQMARVAAAKTIETMLDLVSERTGVGRQVEQRRQPGLQIVIVQRDGSEVVAGPPPAPLIEATPAEVVPVPPDLDNDT